jgi:hypothetical protein
LAFSEKLGTNVSRPCITIQRDSYDQPRGFSTTYRIRVYFGFGATGEGIKLFDISSKSPYLLLTYLPPYLLLPKFITLTSAWSSS